ncbi:MAG: protein phosphatase 2C domain-containing protein [Gemmatimonadota bacterium]|nr:protein phosphatase 2C domain-containing protein [Gemmatimonadota bacterium]
MTAHENPPQPFKTVDAFGFSHIGNVRPANEDHFLVAALSRSLELRHTNLQGVPALEGSHRAMAHLFVVADGVGGVAGGQLASGEAVRALTEYVGLAATCFYSTAVEAEQEFIEQLERAVARADQRVKEYAPTGRGPATTLTMAILVGERAYIVHVGDSRGYHYRAGRLRQFTQDQTMSELMVDEGVMTEEQAQKAGLDHVLSGAIGSEYTPSIGVLDLQLGDILLLCTDGLTKHVADENIAAILKQPKEAEAACNELVDEALDRGGTDNVTAIVARMIPS